jgi:AhpD family alkylhydroperoxidase
MARIPPVPEESVTPEIRAAYERVKKKYGKLLEPVSIAANHPEFFKAYISFEGSFAAATRMDSKLKQLAYLKVAALIGCPFCIDLGSALAKKAGISEIQMRELPRYRQSLAFTDEEKLVLDLAEAMTEKPVQVPDSLFAQLQERFDSAQIVEITAAIALENFRSRFNHALGVEAHGFSEGSYCEVVTSGTQ